MKNKRFLCIVGVCYLFFSGIFYYKSTKIVDKRLSIVEINDIVYTIQENIDRNAVTGDSLHIVSKNTNRIFTTKQALHNIEDIIDKYHHAICIIDKNDTVLYQSNKEVSKSYEQALKLGDTVIDLFDEGEEKGYILIGNQANTVKKLKQQISLYIFSSGILVLIILTVYSKYLERKIVKPFHQLNTFAKDVAAGNLDTPLVMDKDNVFGAFTESFDIMREQLSIARENEQKANQSKKELVASLSHDIKTPLASIKALSEVLMVTVQNDKQLDKIRSIEKKAIQIEELTNDLFHSTLEELQTIKVEPKEEESIVAYELLERADYQHKIATITIPECLILCDKLRLQQVFDNIIYNSYKYADTDIVVHSDIIDDYLEICIRDYGSGVDDKELPLLMQKYYRGSNSKGKNGAGIGLYMCSYFMDKMNGKIMVDSKEDGFEVCIGIPLVSNH